MCIGVPMRVVAPAETSAVVEVDGETRTVSTLLVGQSVCVGDWVLVHADSAVRRMSEDEARQVSDALRAVLAAVDGRDFEHLIADLIDREPELPEHLRD